MPDVNPSSARPVDGQTAPPVHPPVDLEAMIHLFLELPEDMRRLVGALVASLHDTHLAHLDGWASARERDDAQRSTTLSGLAAPAG